MLMLIIALLFPLLALFLEARFSFCKKLGSIVICYAGGILIGNLGYDFSTNPLLKNVVDISIPIAIPMFIYGTDFLAWLRHSRATVIAFTTCILSVCLTTIGISLAFSSQLPEAWQVGGMLVGVYTGGTPNLTAIGQSLGASGETIILTNSMDMVMGSVFLAVLLFFGKRFLQNFLVVKELTPEELIAHEEIDHINLKALLPGGSLGLGLSIASLGFSFALSHLIFKGLHVGFLIFMVSSIGILFSFVPKIRTLRGPFEFGQYLLMFFCFGIGLMANFKEMISQGGPILVMVFLVVLISVTLHFIIAKMLKIDRDTAVITCVAGIFGPPFVPLIADRFQNKSMIVPGITSGLIGLAVGNYLGLAVAHLLKNFIL